MLHPLANDVSLRGLLAERRNLDRQYLLSLTDENLLRPYYMEAGLLRMMYMPSDMHGGWESPLLPHQGHRLRALAQRRRPYRGGNR